MSLTPLFTFNFALWAKNRIAALWVISALWTHAGFFSGLGYGFIPLAIFLSAIRAKSFSVNRHVAATLTKSFASSFFCSITIIGICISNWHNKYSLMVMPGLYSIK
jgi:hypothetical protein